MYLKQSSGFPGGTVVRNLLADAGRCERLRFIPWVGKIPLHGKWQPIPGFLPGESHGQRSLVGYSSYVSVKWLQSCPTLCSLIDHSPPRSSVHGILQARILEWVAVPSSTGSSQPSASTTFELPVSPSYSYSLIFKIATSLINEHEKPNMFF